MGGVSLLLVEKNSPGVEVRRMKTQGWWISNTACISLILSFFIFFILYIYMYILYIIIYYFIYIYIYLLLLFALLARFFCFLSFLPFVVSLFLNMCYLTDGKTSLSRMWRFQQRTLLERRMMDSNQSCTTSIMNVSSWPPCPIDIFSFILLFFFFIFMYFIIIIIWLKIKYARVCLEDAWKYAQVRTAFGKTLIEQPVLSFLSFFLFFFFPSFFVLSSFFLLLPSFILLFL